MRRAEQLEMPPGLTLDTLRRRLRGAGAVFAFVHGSRVAGTARAGSDLDVAAWFGRPVPSWDVELGPAVDLLVLDTAGLELAGRVAQRGVLVLDDDPPLRVGWQADRTKRYLDEEDRRARLVATVLGTGTSPAHDG
ncbi:MAG: nucleotidyltransferase domain-containing protein [Actinomycetota bacterium]